MPLPTAMATIAVLTGPARLVRPPLATLTIPIARRTATMAIFATTLAALFGLCGGGRSRFAAGLCRRRRIAGPVGAAATFTPPIAPAMAIAVALAFRPAIHGPVLTAMAAPGPPDLDKSLFNG